VPLLSENLSFLYLSRTGVTGPGLAPYLRTRPKLSQLTISGLKGVNDDTLDLIRDNLPGFSLLYINDGAEITGIKSLLHLVYEVPIDNLQILGVPIVDEDAESAIINIRYEDILLDYGFRD